MGRYWCRIRSLLNIGRGPSQPLFTAELLRDLQDHQDMIRTADGRWIASPEFSWERLPAKVEGVIERRIGRLPLTYGTR